jgi:hypothetical protein
LRAGQNTGPIHWHVNPNDKQAPQWLSLGVFEKRPESEIHMQPLIVLTGSTGLSATRTALHLLASAQHVQN